MTRNRKRSIGVGAVGLAMIGCLTLVCCQKPTAQVETDQTPEVAKPEPTPAPVVTQKPPTQTAEPVAAPPPPTPQPSQPGADAVINMDQDEAKKPPLPPFLAVVEEINPTDRSTVNATITPPRKLALETDNVKRLRLTRERLPLARNRSIVLQIDGQGIEWTAKHIAIELERSSAGEWTVVRRRPDNQ